MSELITTPTFKFKQGDIHDGGEEPIQVIFYRDGIIELNQDGQEIIIQEAYLAALYRKIKNLHLEAKHFIEPN